MFFFFLLIVVLNCDLLLLTFFSLQSAHTKDPGYKFSHLELTGGLHWGPASPAEPNQNLAGIGGFNLGHSRKKNF